VLRRGGATEAIRQGLAKEETRWVDAIVTPSYPSRPVTNKDVRVYYIRSD